jgi:hypothetical protein
VDINIIKTIKISGRLSEEEKTAIETTFDVLNKFDDIIRSAGSGNISDFIETYYATFLDALADLSENENEFVDCLNVYMEK